jgi:hypothetical protein
MKSTIRIRAFQGGKQALQAEFFEAAFVTAQNLYFIMNECRLKMFEKTA